MKGIRIDRYSNHARMYVDKGLTDKEIYPIYAELYKEFEDKCHRPVIVFYRCRLCGEWESSAYPCYCKGYPTSVGSKYTIG